MKKSEMLDKILDVLENWEIHHFLAAKQILQLVEDEGMKPPENPAVSPNSKNFYKWEPEDE